MHVEVSHVVKAQREKVYAAYTDFEAWPKWSRQATTMRVVGRVGGMVSIESETVPCDKPHITVVKLTLSPPEEVETEGETRLTRTRRTVRFEDVAEGTRVTAALDVRVKGLVISLQRFKVPDVGYCPSSLRLRLPDRFHLHPDFNLPGFHFA